MKYGSLQQAFTTMVTHMPYIQDKAGKASMNGRPEGMKTI